MSKGTCQFADCAKAHYSRGWCRTHYKRWQRWGDPAGKYAQKGEAMAWIERLLANPVDGCVEWPFNYGTWGYGTVHYEGRGHNAHAIVLTLVEGPAPGMQACHKPIVYHNRACVNPAHLYWGTAADNAQDRRLDGVQPRRR